LLRPRWTFLFRLWLRLSTRCGRWSCWRCDTLASWLLLSHRSRRSFSLRRTGPTLDLLLLSAWLLLLRLLAFLSALLLLNATRFTLLLLLHRSRRLSFALITYLELLSLRMIGRIVRTHPLRKIRPERR
jgi:hypothetical protein